MPKAVMMQLKMRTVCPVETVYPFATPGTNAPQPAGMPANS